MLYYGYVKGVYYMISIKFDLYLNWTTYWALKRDTIVAKTLLILHCICVEVTCSAQISVYAPLLHCSPALLTWGVVRCVESEEKIIDISITQLRYSKEWMVFQASFRLRCICVAMSYSPQCSSFRLCNKVNLTCSALYWVAVDDAQYTIRKADGVWTKNNALKLGQYWKY